jgi:beta-lactamase regulating signal transducer with metallopeptidase domain
MKEILLTELKISLALAIFCMAYRFLLGNDTFFIRNRFYLLGAMLLSFIVPWLKFETKVYQTVSEISEMQFTAIDSSPIVLKQETNLWPLFINILLVIYIAGVLFYLIRFLWAYNKIIRLIINSERKKIGKLILVITRLSITPFSLFRWLIVPNHQVDHPEFENIVQHESIHSRQYHSVDLFLAELMVAFQWFNPFAWYLKKSMVENHEFIVDREIVQNGMDSKKYQYLLLNLTTGSEQPASVNYFNTNLLKKRICMINKTKSPLWHGVKNGIILLSLTLVVAFTATFETKVIAQTSKSEPLLIVNGKKFNGKVKDLDPDKIQSINVINDSLAMSKYGIDEARVVIEVTLKDTISIQNDNLKMGIKDTIPKVKNNSVKEFDIKIVGYGNQKSVNKGIVFRDTNSNKNPLIIIDGKVFTKEEFNQINPADILSIEVIIDKATTDKYGENGKNGVILVTLKNVINNMLPSSKSMEDIKVIGNGKPIKDTVAHQTLTLTDKNKVPLIFLDDKRISYEEINKHSPQELKVIEGEEAVLKYGKEGKNGVLLYYTTIQDAKPDYNTKLRSTTSKKNPLIILDGKIISKEEFEHIKPDSISSIAVLTDKTATDKYGDFGMDNVIEVTLK